MSIRNLSVKQKYKDLNPVQLKKLNLLDKNNILCYHLKELISKFKFCLDYQEVNELKMKINASIHNSNKVIKIINNFIKNNIKKKFLIINFDIYYSDYFIEVRNNKLNFYYQDFFKREYSESESEEDEIEVDYPDSSEEHTPSESDMYVY